MSFNVKRETVELAVVIVGIVIAFTIMFLFAPRKGEVIIINCSISEISPDFTPEMRDACRKLRAENFKENLQKPK